MTALRLCVSVILLAWSAFAGDGFVYQQAIEDETLKNSNNRQPIEASENCPPGELLYPGDQKADWICDCKPAYLFDPTTDKCHEVYKQGPCHDGEYIVLSADKVLPECVANPCKKDGLVMFHTRCEKINFATGFCSRSNPKQLVLGVNATSLELTCVEAEPVASLGNRFGDELIKATTNDCPAWSRRDNTGQCKKIPNPPTK